MTASSIESGSWSARRDDAIPLVRRAPRRARRPRGHPVRLGVGAGASTASTSRSSTSATAPASCSAWSITPTTSGASSSCASPAPCATGPARRSTPTMATGEVEVGDCTVEVLSAAEPPPFPIDARAADVDESVRLRHRYLDLRRERMQRNLRLRADVNSAIRGAMERQGFTEVETPMLMPSTPEGAREFLVPARQQPGSFYALPQSPQLFKQLLMVGGHGALLPDRPLPARRGPAGRPPVRVHAARCRDELRRPGRRARPPSPRRCSTPPSGSPARGPTPSPRSPGTRRWTATAPTSPTSASGWSWSSSTSVFAATEFNAFAAAPAIKGIRVEGQGDVGRKRLDALTDDAKALGAKGLVWMRVRGPREVVSRPSPSSSPRTRSPGWWPPSAPRPATSLLLVADEWHTTCEVLGGLRNQLGRPPVSEGPLPLRVDRRLPDVRRACRAEGHPKPAHHPFTRPHPDDVDKLESDPMAVRSRAYDLVLNGWELGSGSIRIHEPELQQRDLLAARHLRRGGRPALRVLPRPVPIRRAAPRRVRVRHRPAGGDPRRRGQHPRGHRLPEAAERPRPDDRRAHPGRRRPARRARPPHAPPQGLNRRDPIVRAPFAGFAPCRSPVSSYRPTVERRTFLKTVVLGGTAFTIGTRRWPADALERRRRSRVRTARCGRPTPTAGSCPPGSPRG